MCSFDATSRKLVISSGWEEESNETLAIETNHVLKKWICYETMNVLDKCAMTKDRISTVTFDSKKD